MTAHAQSKEPHEGRGCILVFLSLSKVLDSQKLLVRCNYIQIKSCHFLGYVGSQESMDFLGSLQGGVGPVHEIINLRRSEWVRFHAHCNFAVHRYI